MTTEMKNIDIQSVVGTLAKTAMPAAGKVAGTVRDVAQTDVGADCLKEIERGMRDRALKRLQADSRFEKATGIAVKASRIADTVQALAPVAGVARGAVERNFAADRSSRSL